MKIMLIHVDEYKNRVSISVFGLGGIVGDAGGTYNSNSYQLESSIDINYCEEWVVLS